jgi:hypothetical protein
MGCEEVLRLLTERETAFRAEADRLEAEAEHIAGLLAACRKELERLVVAREVIGELPQRRRSGPREAGGGGAVLAPGAGPEDLVDQLEAALAELGRPARCQEVVAHLGEDAGVPRHVERVRHRLKKLARAGRVAEAEPGLFTLARAHAAAGG